jgi:hypothetical protein
MELLTHQGMHQQGWRLSGLQTPIVVIVGTPTIAPAILAPHFRRSPAFTAVWGQEPAPGLPD